MKDLEARKRLDGIESALKYSGIWNDDFITTSLRTLKVKEDMECLFELFKTINDEIRLIHEYLGVERAERSVSLKAIKK